MREAKFHKHSAWRRALVGRGHSDAQRRKQGPAAVSPPNRTRARADVEQRRRVIVALLRQHPGGLTAREICEATGISRNLTASALSGLFTRGVLHKRWHRYMLAAHEEDAIDRSQQR